MNTVRRLFAILHRRDRTLVRDPARDWLMLIGVASLVLTAIVVWNVWAFDTVANGRVIGSVATTTEPLLNQTSLEAVRDVFSERAAEEAKYVSGAYGFADPSQ